MPTDQCLPTQQIICGHGTFPAPAYLNSSNLPSEAVPGSRRFTGTKTEAEALKRQPPLEYAASAQDWLQNLKGQNNKRAPEGKSQSGSAGHSPVLAEKDTNARSNKKKNYKPAHQFPINPFKFLR